MKAINFFIKFFSSVRNVAGAVATVAGAFAIIFEIIATIFRKKENSVEI